jgi:lipoate---protein ligase
LKLERTLQVLPYIKPKGIMTIDIRPYNLPDAFLFNGTVDGSLIWKPDDYYIVLGQSNTPEKSLVLENILSDNIPITKRPTGGEAVLLTPEMVVVSIARRFTGFTSSKYFFNKINNAIIKSIKDFGVSGLGLMGISDIAIGNRKILGSSMHRKDSRLVYHAVINVAEDPAIFNRYLCHPSREPDYRNQRNHDAFVTSLTREGYLISPGDLVKQLSYHINYSLSDFPVSQVTI